MCLLNFRFEINSVFRTTSAVAKIPLLFRRGISPRRHFGSGARKHIATRGWLWQ